MRVFTFVLKFVLSKLSMLKSILQFTSAIVLLTLPQGSLAAPDAGSILQQLEARPGGTLFAPQLKTPKEPTLPAANSNGPVVRVNSFSFEGHTLLKEHTLSDALTGFVQRDLSFTQLQEAAWVVVQTYRSAGWLVNVMVPQQEIEGGVVKLSIVEARLGQVLVDFPSTLLPQQLIKDMVGSQLSAGQMLNLQQLDRLLLLLDDMPGVVATASFVEGSQVGYTDVRIVLGTDKPIDTNFTVDNFGATSTGRQRLSASMSFSNPWGWGDALQLQSVNTEGSRYGRAAYTLPVGLQGMRAGIHATDMRYLLEGSFASLQASGTALSWGFDFSAPLLRQPERNLSAQLSTDRKRFNNLALANPQANEATAVSLYRLDVLRAGLVGNWLDTFATTAQNSANLQASWGKVNLNHSPNAVADANAAKTHGTFNKLNLQINREQRLTSRASAYLQASAQWANRNLDSSEKLYLGGASGIRAYPSNEAGGTSGATATAGVRYRVSDGMNLNAFVDWGNIHVYKNNINSSGTELTEINSQTLKGIGLNVTWRSLHGPELSATWSRRQGVNPAASALSGVDSDGTRILNRLWLSASLIF